MNNPSKSKTDCMCWYGEQLFFYRFPKSLRVSDQPFLGQSLLVNRKVDKSDGSNTVKSTGKGKLKQILAATKR